MSILNIGALAGLIRQQACRSPHACCAWPRQYGGMFLFFSNKLGWIGSIAVSLVLTLVLLALFGWF